MKKLELTKELIKYLDKDKEFIPKVEDSKYDRDTVEYFKDQIKNNKYEPILLSNSDDTIIDENHRALAYKELGIEPPLLYKGNRKKFFILGNECNWDGIKMIKQMIKNGTAKRV